MIAGGLGELICKTYEWKQNRGFSFFSVRSEKILALVVLDMGDEKGLIRRIETLIPKRRPKRRKERERERV